VARYNANGSTDTTFGAGKGYVITDFGGSSKYLYVDSRGFKVDEYPSIFVRNGAGIDFLVYQSDTIGAASNWAGLKVEVSQDGTTWYTAAPHAASARITGDGLHNDPSNVLRRGYDLGDLRDAGDNAASLALIRRIRLTCTSGTFKLDAVGIVSTGMGPEGVVFPTLVSENTTGNLNAVIVAAGAPDDLSASIPAGTHLTFSSVSRDYPSLIPVNRTELVAYTATEDLRQILTGNDHLYVSNTAATGALTGSLATVQLPADKYVFTVGNGRVTIHAGTVTEERLTVDGDGRTLWLSHDIGAAAVSAGRIMVVRQTSTPPTAGTVAALRLGVDYTVDAVGNKVILASAVTGSPAFTVVYALETKSYFGGEPVLKVVSSVEDGQTVYQLLPDTYAGGELVYDVITGLPVLDPYGVQLVHQAGDPRLHFRGEPVLQNTNDLELSLGGQAGTDRIAKGEIILDESGAPVLNGDGTFFVAQPGQAKIHNRRENVFVPFTYEAGPGALTAGQAQTFNLGRTFGADDQLVAVTVISDVGIFQLDPGDVVFDRSGHLTITAKGSYVVGPATRQTSEIRSVKVVATFALRAFHAAGDLKRYFGDEVIQVGQPVVDDNGDLVIVETEAGATIVATYTDNMDDPGLADGTKVFWRNSLEKAKAGFATQPLYHRRGEVVYKSDGNGGFVEGTFAGGEPVEYLGNEPRRYFGGERAFYAANDVVQESQALSRIDGIGLPEGILFINLSEITINLGAGDDVFTIVDTPSAVTLNTGGGNDQVAVRTIDGNTTINAGSGDDVVKVGSNAGFYTTLPGQFLNLDGTVEGIRATLTVNGGENAGSGDLLAGTHGARPVTRITTGQGNDTVNVKTISGPTYIDTGAGDDIIHVGSTTNLADPIPGSTLNWISNDRLVLTAGEGTGPFPIVPTLPGGAAIADLPLTVKMVTLAGDVRVGDSWTLTVDGVSHSYAVAAGDDMAHVASGLARLIDGAIGLVAAAEGSTVVITKIARGPLSVTATVPAPQSDGDAPLKGTRAEIVDADLATVRRVTLQGAIVAGGQWKATAGSASAAYVAVAGNGLSDVAAELAGQVDGAAGLAAGCEGGSIVITQVLGGPLNVTASAPTN
ncbi:MAG: hypothetical protein NTU94_01835, partial [Planctomycetota bacterium]|nr:hypothetical protein [Planctomycetota bacterium]